MNKQSQELSDFSMLELFRMEAETQLAALTAALLKLEANPAESSELEGMMRAAHSLKGAARIVILEPAVRVAHVMEDRFVAAQCGTSLTSEDVDLMLQGVDILRRLSLSEAEATNAATLEEIAHFVAGKKTEAAATTSLATPATLPTIAAPPVATLPARTIETAAASLAEPDDRSLRVNAANLNRLLGLSGESLVESRWPKAFSNALLKLKRQQGEIAQAFDLLREKLPNVAETENFRALLIEAQSKVLRARQYLSDRLTDLDAFDRRSSNLSTALYEEALACRMRPFGDAIQGFPRMVRDLARQQGKEIKYIVLGEKTQVDRDVLEKLEPPLTHLLRNAIDHGIEMPAARMASGKSETGTITLEALHVGGMLQITVTDDGHGVNYDGLREKIVARAFTTGEVAAKLSHPELLEFLFLPGFSMRSAVTEISGRGVGLDVVQSMIKTVQGSVRVFSETGLGMRFLLQMPLTLSVARTLLIEISGETYAFPLSQIAKTLLVPKDQVLLAEGRRHVTSNGVQIGLVWAHQVLAQSGSGFDKPTLPVVVVCQGERSYGLVVDQFLGEKELVVQPLDSRLGKIENVSAGGLLEDGSPVLILDSEDVIRSMDKLISGGGLTGYRDQAHSQQAQKRKRILVVDDSLTVRELERKLLASSGYEVEVAVDGADGWNAVRTGHFSLVVTDVDMPRMDGIELVKMMKKDAKLHGLPVMIVSYKDREEDRERGLEAGADYYLTKGSFHDESLINAVRDLIGEASE